jgi:hypothetical protein
MTDLTTIATRRRELVSRQAGEAARLHEETAQAIRSAMDGGMTGDQVAEALGVTRQRVYQLLSVKRERK